MDILKEIEERINQKYKKHKLSSEEAEKIAVDYLNSVDFKDQSIQAQTLEYTKHVLTNKIGLNEELSSLQAKTMHCMIAKLSLARLGLDCKVNYRDKRESDRNAAAYYSPSDKSINFFNSSVCNKYELLLPYGSDVEHGPNSRMNYFVIQIFTMQHEIQHAVQFDAIEKGANDKKELTVDDYIISKQSLARVCSERIGTKYYKEGLDADRLYYDNHDQFYDELDADLWGYKRALDFFSEVSTKAYDIAIDNKLGWDFLSKIEDRQTQINNYSDITWEHDTNPDNVKVSANYKAAMIIDNVLPLYIRKNKETVEKYLSIFLAYNKDGSKKDLAQIEKEFEAKKNNLLLNGTDEQIMANMSKLEQIYSAVIESDPLLSLENSLQHISRMSWESEKYYTDAGTTVKYDANAIHKELRKSKEKAEKIVGCIEDTHAKRVKKIVDKYKKEIEKSSKNGNQNIRFYEDKKLVIYGLEGLLYGNKEANDVIENDRKQHLQKKLDEQAQKDKMIKTIKDVFPDFVPDPHPLKGFLYNGRIEMTNNVEEKMMLREACNRYSQLLKNSPKTNENKEVVKPVELLMAINTLYNFQPTDEESAEFDEALDAGKIDVIKNKYELEKEEVKANAGYTQEEIERSKHTTTFMWSQPEKSAETKKPDDPEKDGTLGIYRRPFRTATDIQQRQIREQEKHAKSHEPIGESKNENTEYPQHNVKTGVKKHEEPYIDESGVIWKNGKNHKENEKNRYQDFGMSR